MKSLKPLRISFWVAIAALSFFAMAASSPQCAQSSADRVNGPSLQPSAPDPCKQDCLAEFKSAKQDEKARFKAAKVACNGDYECVAEEVAIHEAINAEIVADKELCFDACMHQQGAATGGQ